MDFLEDDSVDQADQSQITTRSQEKVQLDEDLMKLIDDSLDTKIVTSAIDTLAQNFKGLDLSADMPSSIEGSNSNQSFEEVNAAQEYNSTSGRSSDSGENFENSKTKSQIISAPKHSSLFSMDFLEDDSVDQADQSQITTRSQEKVQLDEDLMKLIDDSLDTKIVTSAIDTLAQNFKGLDLSADMPSSIEGSNSNQSFEEVNAAQEYFPAMGQQLYFPPLQQLQLERQMPTIA